MESIFGTTKNRRRSIGLKLSVLARQLRLSFDRTVQLRGLTRAKWTLIAAVSRNPGATQRTIAQALEVREITVGRLIDRLCEDGYLKRSQNPADRRAYRVYLAAGAQPVLDKLDEVAKLHEAAIFAGFDNEDLERLDELLERMARNLSAANTLRAAAK
ncbi:MAG TPA: MarR family transcriptional regulator [Steroidobacteraceae bacterium]|nr:MarR family transcriptional regulator [Steroidobacteraceae bacterium]